MVKDIRNTQLNERIDLIDDNKEEQENIIVSKNRGEYLSVMNVIHMGEVVSKHTSLGAMVPLG